MRFFLLFCVLAASFSLFQPALAQEESLVKPGQTVLNIAASERKVVPQDLLIASLRFESDSTDPRALQSKINGLMQKALDKAKSYEAVDTSTDHYYVYSYDPNQNAHPDPEERIKDTEEHKLIWKGSQGLQLKSKNSEALLKLMGELQDMGFQSSGLTYTLSPETFEAVRDSMMEGALAKLAERAKRAAKALGKDSAELVEVNVDTGYPSPPMPMMARAEMAQMKGGADMAAPSADPGESEITLSVNARAVLK